MLAMMSLLPKDVHWISDDMESKIASYKPNDMLLSNNQVYRGSLCSHLCHNTWTNVFMVQPISVEQKMSPASIALP